MRVDRSLRGRTTATNSRFARSIQGAIRDNSLGSWDRRAPSRRSRSDHPRRLARVSIVCRGTIMNASNVRPTSPRYKLLFSNAARLAVILCVLPGFATYPAALRAEEVRTITAQAAAAIAARPETPAAGARHGDLTIIEFLDYNCPFCKKTAPELQKLLRSDPRVRILYKERPIFGDDSENAARSAPPASWQG